ncbi:MAG: sorbosone dehydrogenase family protein, partial [Deltaproteobacteria bacterium]|nr:sorbosone dehydrogenase family protein [Deltaproteobacteria bacterium]
MKKAAIVLALLIAALVGACRWILPREMVVNADLGHMLFGIGIDPPEPEVLESRLRVPEGLGVALWAEGLRGARMLRFTPAGDLLVSLPRSGEIHLLLADRDGDLRSDGDRILAEGLD